MTGKSGWTDCSLGDVVTLKRGYDLPHRDRVEGRYPIISSSGVTGRHNVAKVKGPGVVTGRYGTLGEVFYIPGDFWPLNTSLYVEDFKGNHPLFISYFLKTLNFGQRSGAAAVPGVNRNTLHMLQVRKPDLNIQWKIASILSAYDDLIENSTWRIKILEEMAQDLYREWFVKFRFPGHEKVKMIDSTLGMIPEGWEIVRYSDLIAHSIGGDWGKEEAEGDFDQPVTVIRGTDFDDVTGGSGLRTPKRFIKESSVGKRRLEEGDIIVENSVNANSRCVGKTLLVTKEILRRTGDNTICASFCKLFRPIDTKFSPMIHLHMKYLHTEGKMHFYNNVAANGIGNFQSKRFLESEAITIPKDSALLGRMLKALSDLTTTIFSGQISNLRRTLDLLLPKLVSGQVDVSELDIKTGGQINE